jgi:hypothetical protein
MARGLQRGKGLGSKRLLWSINLLDVYVSVCIISQR